MLDGHMEHRDSLANCGDLQAGGAQWMKAARGVIHSEMPKQTAGRMRGFQLWVNLPAMAKMDAPEYRDFAAQEIPEVVSETARIRVFAGQYGGRQGVVGDPHTELIYLDIALSPGARFAHPLPPGHTAFVYVFEGAAMLADVPLPGHGLAVLGEGDGVELAAADVGARLILVAGRPLGEPIVQYGPFVMNTREEIEQAYADYRAGRFVSAA
jgi:redox-sensitive bicupin YhaK (pirin superfamily)